MSIPIPLFGSSSAQRPVPVPVVPHAPGSGDALAKSIQAELRAHVDAFTSTYKSWLDANVGRTFLTEHQSLADYLKSSDAAAAYQPKGTYLTSVPSETTLTDTDAKLPTSRAVKTFVEGKGYAPSVHSHGMFSSDGKVTAPTITATVKCGDGATIPADVTLSPVRASGLTLYGWAKTTDGARLVKFLLSPFGSRSYLSVTTHFLDGSSADTSSMSQANVGYSLESVPSGEVAFSSGWKVAFSRSSTSPSSCPGVFSGAVYREDLPVCLSELVNDGGYTTSTAVDTGKRYEKHRPAKNSSGKYELRDFAVNVIDVTAAGTVYVVLPKPTAGRVRDFVLKLNVTASGTVSVSVSKHADDSSTPSFEGEDGWEDIEAGVNFLSFTETE